MIRTILPICDRNLWALKPFSYLHNVFWSEEQSVLVIGFKAPDFEIPKNFSFHSIGPVDPGPQYWSDQLIEGLSNVEDEHLIVMLEDYWINRGVDHRGVATLHEYCDHHPEVLRMDLTADRLYAGGMFEVDHYGCYDIVETRKETPYQMSLQAAIWNRTKLLSVLRPGLTPWEVETVLSNEVKEHYRILGSRQWPTRYANVFNSANPGMVMNLEQIPDEHVKYMRGQGWIK